MQTFVVCRGYPGILWIALKEVVTEADDEQDALQKGTDILGPDPSICTWAWSLDEYDHQRTVRAAGRVRWSFNHPANALSPTRSRSVSVSVSLSV